MATKSSKYFTVDANVISKTATSAVIKWTWSKRRSGSYFGYCNSSEALAIKGVNGYKNHLGIPTKWQSKWGWRSKYLTDGQNHQVVSSWGSLKGLCADSGTYEETITLDRGNQRSITKVVTVGIEGTKAEKANWECLVDLTVSSAEIKYPENVSGIQVEVDPVINETRYIHLTFTYTNPENYYTAYLYDKDGDKLEAIENISIRPGYVGKDILITRDMFNQSKIYRVIIKGKDGIEYGNYTTDPIDIQPSGLGVFFKLSDQVETAESAYFKNVNHKQIPKIYTKINGKIIEIRK